MLKKKIDKIENDKIKCFAQILSTVRFQNKSFCEHPRLTQKLQLYPLWSEEYFFYIFYYYSSFLSFLTADCFFFFLVDWNISLNIHKLEFLLNCFVTDSHRLHATIRFLVSHWTKSFWPLRQPIDPPLVTSPQAKIEANNVWFPGCRYRDRFLWACL